MGSGSHESYASEAVKPPSERSTGLVFTAVAFIVAAIFRDNQTVLITSAAVGAVLLIASLVAPKILAPLNIVWFKFGQLLHAVVSPVVMLLMFAVAIVPAGLLMRLVRDPLRSRRTKDETYWVPRVADPAHPSSMENQF